MSTESMNEKIDSIGSLKSRFQKHSRIALACELAVCTKVYGINADEVANALKNWEQTAKLEHMTKRLERLRSPKLQSRKRRRRTRKPNF